MGWIEQGAYDHEGWVGLVLADGRISLGTTAGGAVVHFRSEDNTAEKVAAGWVIEGDPSKPGGYVRTIAPWSEVVAWRVVCTCGWDGTQRPVTSEPGSSQEHVPLKLQNEVFRPQWQAHVKPYVALASLNETIVEFQAAQARLRLKVMGAVGAGVEWPQICRNLQLGFEPEWEIVRALLGLRLGSTRDEFEAAAREMTDQMAGGDPPENT